MFSLKTLIAPAVKSSKVLKTASGFVQGITALFTNFIWRANSSTLLTFGIAARPMIELAFREFGRGGKTLVILHGLLGSSQNWQRAAKVFAEASRVLALDLRNHGESPHTPTHSFFEMREDVKRFFDERRLDGAYLLGHSMGGGVAMDFAFHYPDLLAGLIIEDIAPRAYQNNTGDILETLAAIDLKKIASRQQADAELAKSLSSPVTRQFLLTNLVRHDDDSFSWRMNLPVLLAFRREIAAYAPLGWARYTGETLFIGGEKSAYRIDQDRELIQRHFPNSRLKMIPNAGHWLHFESLESFTELVKRFMESGLATFR
jgi:pimeloyl-ACP methyl ester carboxylesterase